MDETQILEFSDAVIYGDFEKVKEMLKEDKAFIHAKDKYGFTALHNAMSEEQFAIVAYLITLGADVNAQNDEGISPLHLACYVENAELLVKGGADINLTDIRGNTPLHTLISDGEERLELIAYLLSIGANKALANNAGQSPLDFALARQEASIIELFS